MAFAAVEPIIPDNVPTFPVIDRCAPEYYLTRGLNPTPLVVQIGDRLGDLTPKNRPGSYISKARPDASGYEESWGTAKLSAKFVNADKVITAGGTYTEPVRIYVTENPEIWIDVAYTFTVGAVERTDLSFRADQAMDENGKPVNGGFVLSSSFEGKGTATFKVGGEVIAEGVKSGESVSWTAPSAGAYEITMDYVTVEGDDVVYKPASVTNTVTAVFRYNVTVSGGTGAGAYQPGKTVSVNLDSASIPANHKFKGWKVTNAAGETVDLGETDLQQESISFTMPGEDITVEAQTSFSIVQLFINVVQKIISWLQGLFNPVG